MDKITKYFSRNRPRLKKKFILMKFWTFLKKKIGAFDCNKCIILFKKFVYRNVFGGGDQRFGGGDQRFGGGGGYPRAPPPP